MRDAARFIVLEGGDGVGKTTQVALLSAFLEARGVPFVATREPGGTAVGEAIRELVLGRRDLEMPAETELLLILAARAAFVRDVVSPALARGELVLADRFSLSTLAYQGYGRGIPLDHVRVGLEDNLYLEKGVFASNAQLVERARKILELMGCSLQSPAEARETLGLRRPIS